MYPLELTLAILKPHIVAHPHSLSSIRAIISNSNFKIVKSKMYKLCTKDAEQLYQEHKHKFYYNRLVTSMTSGASEFYILAGINVIQNWRNLLGPTRFYKTQYENPNTIRGMFGLSDTRNAAHGSDSQQTAYREIALMFPEFNIEEWYRNEREQMQHDFKEYSNMINAT